MDKIKVAITKLSMLSERQINFLMNEKLNNKLPPFVNLGTLGLNLGMQGVQFTATSTVAENQMLSNSMYVHSIPTNNDNQDIVSMGTNAALMAMKVIDNSFEVLAIELIALLQAVDFLGYKERLSPITNTVYSKLRKIVPVFKEDSPKYKDIRRISNYIQANDSLS
jgi:histidine ammonia-lyase